MRASVAWWVGWTGVATACAPRLYTPIDTADTSGVVDSAAASWVAPTNGWPMTTPPAGLVAEGWAPGQVVPDVRASDAAGDEVSLWQFYGLTVLVDISTMWCGPCQDLGAGSEKIYQDFKDEGFLYVTILHEDVDNGDLDADELSQWAGLPTPSAEQPYDTITAPVLADFRGAGGSLAAVENGQYPVALIVGPDLRVVERVDPVTDAQIETLLEAWFAGGG